jgi:hypothetical protein
VPFDAQAYDVSNRDVVPGRPMRAEREPIMGRNRQTIYAQPGEVAALSVC